MSLRLTALLAEGLPVPVEGPPGPPGKVATVEAGTTTTGEPGTDAEVTNSGTESAAVFDFVIPRGDKGEPGDPASNLVTAVFGRQGDIQALTGDYTAAQITNAVDQTQSYNNPQWLTGLDWSKIEGEPASFPPAAHTHGADEVVSGVFGPARLGSGTPSAGSWLRGDGVWTILPADDWSAITGKPATFPPASHTHDWTDITGEPSVFPPAAHTHDWMDITGEPATFPPAPHQHAAADTTAGVFATARLGTGTADGSNFLRGDGTWAVPPAGGGSGAVDSVFGRTGVVVATAGDYTAAQITNAVSTAGSYADPAWITSFAWGKLTGVPASFTPGAHTHSALDIVSDMVATARLGTQTAGTGTYLRGDQQWAIIQWNDVGGKPTSFPPAGHSHPVGDITGLPATYPPDAHTHDWPSITSKPVWDSAHSEAIALSWYLPWKAHGAHHIIFDASGSVTPPKLDTGLTRSCDGGISEIAWVGSYPTLMGWNGINTYGVRVDACRRADSAAAADAVAWGNVSGKPALVLNDGGTYSINITGNANTVAGLAVVANGDSAPPGNQVMRTNASGYLFTGYINSNTPLEAPHVDNVWVSSANTSGDTYMRRCSPAHLAGYLNASIAPTWANVSGKPALCYNDGGTYSINVTGSSGYAGNAGALGTLGLANDGVKPSAQQVLRTSGTNDVYLPTTKLLGTVGGEGGEMQWFDAAGAVFMVADVDGAANPTFRLWRGGGIIYLGFTPATNVTQLRIAGTTYTLTVDGSKFVKVL